MAKKKLKTAKEKYDYLIKRYYIDGTFSDTTKKEKLHFKRSLNALLELRECEEIYMKDKIIDIDFEMFQNILEDLEDGGIINESKKEFFEININNDKISSSDYNWEGDFYVKDKSDKDNSSIAVEPVFDTYVESKKKSLTNRILGIKFKLKSQMGYNITFTETDVANLKKIQNEIGVMIKNIETRIKTYTVIGCGPVYKFESTSDFYKFPIEADERTELLKVDHFRLSDNFKVVDVERDEFGNETWYVEGNEIEKNNNKFKITVKGYPCTFSFTVPIKFKPFDINSEEDDGRSDILLAKMKEFKVLSPAHAYEDYIIEEVEKVKGGEIWTLGS